MSSDLFQENTPVIQPTKLRDEEEILTALVEEFNTIFRRESLEQNLSLVSKMNSSLEIPITMIYRDKKIQSISTNLALIREALSRSTSVQYDKEREILKPLFKARKNKIYVNKMPENLKTEILNTIYSSPEYNERISDKLIDSIRCYNIILKSEEAAASLYNKIKSKLNPNSSFDLIWEFEDLYSNLLQKAQDSYKTQSYNFPDPSFGMNPYGNFFYGMQQNFNMMPPNPFGYRGGNPYNNNYYNGYYNNMFIRKAQDENDDYYDQGGRQGRRKDNRFRKGQNVKKDKNRNHISEEDFDDPSKFPPLGSSTDFVSYKKDDKKPESVEEEKIQTIPEVKLDTNKKAEDIKPAESKKLIRIKRSAMIDIFKKISTQVKPHESLKAFEAGLPVLSLAANPDLEAINPTPPKEVMSTPKLNATTPKLNAK